MCPVSFFDHLINEEIFCLVSEFVFTYLLSWNNLLMNMSGNEISSIKHARAQTNRISVNTCTIPIQTCNYKETHRPPSLTHSDIQNGDGTQTRKRRKETRKRRKKTRKPSLTLFLQRKYPGRICQQEVSL